MHVCTWTRHNVVKPEPMLTTSLPLGPQVRPVAEDEMFKVLRTGKRRKKEWKRMVTKVRRLLRVSMLGHPRRHRWDAHAARL